MQLMSALRQFRKHFSPAYVQSDVCSLSLLVAKLSLKSF